MLRITKIIALAAVISIAVISGAEAGNVFQTATDKGVEIFRNVKNIVFILGGFGLVGLAFGAIFGKIKWNWFGALAVGLAIVAAAGAIIDYATTPTSTPITAPADYGDTFQ